MTTEPTQIVSRKLPEVARGSTRGLTGGGAATGWSLCVIQCAFMNRIIIQGAMNHESGAEITKLLMTSAGIQKKALDISAGMLTTKSTPIPKTTAFTMRSEEHTSELQS